MARSRRPSSLAGHAIRHVHPLMNGMRFFLTFVLVVPCVHGPVAADEIGRMLQDRFIWRGVTETAAGFTVFRKTFSAPDVNEGTLHLFADARYVLWINGQYVQRGPCRFDPSGPEYDTLDVSPYLSPGSNTLAVMVMSYPVGSASHNSKMMRHAPGLTALLTVGSGPDAATVSTDATWKWKNTLRYKAPDIRWGFVNDVVDARLDDGDWTQHVYNDSAWTAAAGIRGAPWGELQARSSPLLLEQDVAIQTGSLPVRLTGGSVAHFALPRMVQGYFEIDVEGAASGSSIKVEVGERGSATAVSETFGSAFQFTAKAGRMRCFTTDTMGFRYLKVSGTGGALTLHGLRVVDRRYPYADAGRFHCSDPWLDELWARAVHTIRMCSDDGYMDCALREKAEWMGDAAVVEYPVSRVTLAGPAVKDRPHRSDAGLMKNMIRHIAQSGRSLGDGRLKAHAPSDRMDIHGYIEDYSCLWVQSLRQVYEHTGDADLVREVWPALTGQMKWFLVRRSEENGLVHAREFVIFDNPLKYATCEGATLNAFVYRALLDSAVLGDAIGKTAEADGYRAAAAELRAHFNRHLWDAAQGTYLGGLHITNGGGKAVSPSATCHAAMLALDRGIVPSDRAASVEAYFLEKYPSAVTYPYTAFWVLENLYALDEGVRDLEAINYIRSKWASVMQRTDTGTLTEGFNSGEPCHNFGASCAYFLSSYILGVQMDGPARDGKLIVEPRPSGLTCAQGDVVTELGVVPVSWTRTNDSFTLRCTVPDGATAVLRIPPGAIGDALHTVLDGQSVADPAVRGRYVVLPLGPGDHRATVGKIGRIR